MDLNDLTTVLVGATAWVLAIYPVCKVGSMSAEIKEEVKDKTVTGALLHNRILVLILGVGVAAATTPLLGVLCGWKSPEQRVRGIAIALGTAQTIDGLVHMFYPSFYSTNKDVAIACSANIFFGAGLLGIFSAYM
jgi:hypothetical protein